MAYYEDLERIELRGFDMLLSVGWLCKAQDFSKGTPPEDFISRLTDLLVWPVQDPFTSYVMFGHHACDLCPLERQSLKQRVGSRSIAVGRRNLFVPKPRSELVYVAPSTIIHYILEHDYLPPEEFQNAVMKCPRMRSLAYYREMRARGACLWSLRRFIEHTNFFGS